MMLLRVCFKASCDVYTQQKTRLLPRSHQSFVPLLLVKVAFTHIHTHLVCEHLIVFSL